MLKIKKLMNERGWSKSKTAREADLNQVTVGLIVEAKQKPFPGQIAKLVAAFGWEGNPEDLFKEVEE